VLPEGNAATVVPQMQDFIADQIALHGADNVAIEGDSAGASIGLAAVQGLVHRGLPAPARMVFVSPAFEWLLTDPRNEQVDDPLIDLDVLRDAGRRWAADLPGGAANPLVSPLYGSLAGLPPTWVYSGSLDALSPQILDLQLRARAEGAPFQFVLPKGGLHGWPGLSWLPEASEVAPAIIGQLLGDDHQPPHRPA
jgi:acetyl esterase/lipase